MPNQILVPSLGESVTEATVSKWLKQVGERVDSDEPLVELETDKVNVEVPSPLAGTLSSIKVKEGDTVEVGGLLGTVNEGKFGSVKSANKESVAQDRRSYIPPKTSEKENIVKESMKKGKKEIQETIAAEVQGGAQDLVLTTLDVYGSGDFAYEVGQYSLNVKQNGQITMQDTGNYIVIWNRQTNDSWLMKADIWNSNLPKD